MSWPLVKLGDIAIHLRNGASIKQTDGAGGLPITRIETISQREVNLEKCGYADINENDYSNYRLEKGDILISHINSEKHLGKCAIFEADRKDIIHGMNLLCFRVNKDVSPKFVYYYLSSGILLSKLPKITNKSVNQASFKVTNFKELEIPLPPLVEQKRIAAILDKADAIRRKRQQAIELADDFLRSVFLDMFGDPVTNPKQWEVNSCSDVSRQITVGLVIRPASYYVEKGVPAIRSQNIKETGIDSSNFVFFSEEDNKTVLAKSRVFEGDVVIVRSGQPGKAAVISKRFDGINAIDVLILRPDKQYFDSDYLAYFINSGAGKNIVMSEERGQVQKHLNVGSLSAARIPVPPLELQKKFVNILMQLRERFSKDNSITHNNLFNSISQKAFAGEL